MPERDTKGALHGDTVQVEIVSGESAGKRREGKIIKIVSNQYTILTEDHQEVLAVAMGKLRKNESPVVSDEVLYECVDGKYLIQKILDRKNYLIIGKN